jgi:gas vesicle protein
MNDAGRTTLLFLAGFGIGAAVALLFAPQSGEETREWIADNAQRQFKMIQRSGRRSMKQIQHAVTKGEEKLAEILKDGKEVVDSVTARLA